MGESPVRRPPLRPGILHQDSPVVAPTRIGQPRRAGLSFSLRFPTPIDPGPPVSILYHIYCDESGHLEHDQQRHMVLGAVWCEADKVREVAERLREIKTAHGLWHRFEIKWTKVSNGQLAFYRDVLDYFFDDDDLHFRAVIADKSQLRHRDFKQSHDDWYYKMYFELLKMLLAPENRYRVFLDVKDTRGGAKVRKLHDVLANSMYDFDRSIIQDLQLVRSHEVELLQLADLLIGTVAYANRPEAGTNAAKQTLVERMRKRSRYELTRSTLLKEWKVNLFHWRPREAGR
jgi:hypothetical protein